jgi:proteasome lid subunit RPN8/RPN11
VFDRFFGRGAHIRFATGDWRAMVAELGRRADGRRESGAFLLARGAGGDRRVRRVVYFDDLDPLSLRGGIEISASAFAALWAICRGEQLRVIGDAHTHPGARVRQSQTDRDNPMIATPGHVALILPDLAAHDISASEVGVHWFDGDAGWTSWYGSEASRAVYVGRFA